MTIKLLVAGRTIMSMLDEIKKPHAPPPPTSAPPAPPTSAPPPAAPTTAPPAAPTTAPPAVPTSPIPHSATMMSATILSSHIIPEKSSSAKPEKSPIVPEVTALTRQTTKTSTIERLEKSLEKVSTNAVSGDKPSAGTLERRKHSLKTEKVESNDALITQLNNRVSCQT